MRLRGDFCHWQYEAVNQAETGCEWHTGESEGWERRGKEGRHVGASAELKEPFRKYKWCSRGRKFTHLLPPACLSALSGDVQRSGWHSASHCRLLREHTSLPARPPPCPPIHRSANANTCTEGGTHKTKTKKKKQVSITKGLYFILPVTSCGCSRRAADLHCCYLFGPSVTVSLIRGLAG